MQFCRIDKRMAQKWENFPSFLKRKCPVEAVKVSWVHKVSSFSTKAASFCARKTHTCDEGLLQRTWGRGWWPLPPPSLVNSGVMLTFGLNQHSIWFSRILRVLIKDAFIQTLGTFQQIRLFRTHGVQCHLTHSLGVTCMLEMTATPAQVAQDSPLGQQSSQAGWRLSSQPWRPRHAVPSVVTAYNEQGIQQNAGCHSILKQTTISGKCLSTWKGMFCVFRWGSLMNARCSSGAPTSGAFGEMHPSSLLANSLKSKPAAPSGRGPYGWAVPFSLHCVVPIYSSRFSTSDSLPGDVTPPTHVQDAWKLHRDLRCWEHSRDNVGTRLPRRWMAGFKLKSFCFNVLLDLRLTSNTYQNSYMGNNRRFHSPILTTKTKI